MVESYLSKLKSINRVGYSLGNCCVVRLAAVIYLHQCVARVPTSPAKQLHQSSSTGNCCDVFCLVRLAEPIWSRLRPANRTSMTNSSQSRLVVVFAYRYLLSLHTFDKITVWFGATFLLEF